MPSLCTHVSLNFVDCFFSFHLTILWGRRGGGLRIYDSICEKGLLQAFWWYSSFHHSNAPRALGFILAHQPFYERNTLSDSVTIYMYMYVLPWNGETPKCGIKRPISTSCDACDRHTHTGSERGEKIAASIHVVQWLKKIAIPGFKPVAITTMNLCTKTNWPQCEVVPFLAHIVGKKIIRCLLLSIDLCSSAV